MRLKMSTSLSLLSPASLAAYTRFKNRSHKEEMCSRTLTESRIPIPAKIILAGGNACKIKVRAEIPRDGNSL